MWYRLCNMYHIIYIITMPWVSQRCLYNYTYMKCNKLYCTCSSNTVLNIKNRSFSKLFCTCLAWILLIWSRCPIICSILSVYNLIKHINEMPSFAQTFKWVSYTSTLTNWNTKLPETVYWFYICLLYFSMTFQILFIHSITTYNFINIVKNVEKSLLKVFRDFVQILDKSKIVGTPGWRLLPLLVNFLM